MQIHVINLDSDFGRWTSMQRQFEALGLDIVRLRAIPGALLGSAEVEALYSPELNRRQYHRSLRRGELGCYASHLAAWRDLLQSNERCRAVFEDDVDIDPALAGVLDAIDRRAADWDIVKLIGRPVEKPLDRSPLASGHTLIRYRRVPSLTGAYVITRRGAQRLLSSRQPFGRPVDVDLRHWWECGIDVAGVQPYPARGAASGRLSSIEDRREPAGVSRRLRKLVWQFNHSIDNWRALHPRARPSSAHSLEEATAGNDAT